MNTRLVQKHTHAVAEVILSLTLRIVADITYIITDVTHAVADVTHTNADEEADEGGDEEGHAESDAVGDGEGDAEVPHDVVLGHEPRRQRQREVCRLNTCLFPAGIVPNVNTYTYSF